MKHKRNTLITFHLRDGLHFTLQVGGRVRYGSARFSGHNVQLAPPRTVVAAQQADHLGLNTVSVHIDHRQSFDAQLDVKRR